MKFRPYLYGRAFKVVTDHHCLCWLANLRDPSGRLARWSLRLQEFDITIVYKSGRKHEDADTLSRAPLDSSGPEIDDDSGFLGILNASDIIARQRADTDLRPLIDNLEGHAMPLPRHFARRLGSFCLREGILYKKNSRGQERAYLLVLPADLRADILLACHDEPTSGHLGFSRTLARIRNMYYWPGLSDDVQRYVKSCRECQRRKTHRLSRRVSQARYYTPLSVRSNRNGPSRSFSVVTLRKQVDHSRY